MFRRNNNSTFDVSGRCVVQIVITSTGCQVTIFLICGFVHTNSNVKFSFNPLDVWSTIPNDVAVVGIVQIYKPTGGSTKQLGYVLAC